MANAPVSQQDFPVLAVILTDTRALTIDRLNGITTPTDVILAVAGVSR